jgi:hypothetical protein
MLPGGNARRRSAFDAAAVERLLGRAQPLPLEHEVRDGMFDDLATPTG